MLSTGLLGKSELFTSDEIIQSDVLRTMLDLICSLKHKSQLAGLGVLAGLALTSAETAKKLLSPKLHQASSHPEPIWQHGQGQTLPGDEGLQCSHAEIACDNYGNCDHRA